MAASITFSAPSTLVLMHSERVVLGGRHLLQRRGVHDDVDAVRARVAGAPRSRTSPRNQRTRGSVIFCASLELLQLVTREHDDAPYSAFQSVFHETAAERPRAAGHQDDGIP